VIVGIPVLSHPQGPTTTFCTFSVNISEGNTNFDEVGSLTVLGLLRDCILLTPPSTSGYALGILTIFESVGDGIDKTERKHYTLRIDLPDPEDPRSGSQCRVVFTRMQLAPAVDEEREVSGIRCFDHFSGRVVLLAHSDDVLREGVVLDYLAMGYGGI